MTRPKLTDEARRRINARQIAQGRAVTKYRYYGGWVKKVLINDHISLSFMSRDEPALDDDPPPPMAA